MTTLKRAVASLQAWWTRLFVLGVLAAFFLDIPVWIDLTAIGLVLALSLVRAPRRDDHPAVAVACPVVGRWAALNSPADKVPSHGIRAYGQAFAIDIAHPRPPGFSPRIGWGLRQRRPDGFSSFGEPVYAVAPGTVVAAGSRQRDHRARTTWPGLLYLMTVESLVRESAGAVEPRLHQRHHRRDRRCVHLVRQRRRRLLRGLVRVGPNGSGRPELERGTSG